MRLVSKMRSWTGNASSRMLLLSVSFEPCSTAQSAENLRVPVPAPVSELRAAFH